MVLEHQSNLLNLRKESFWLEHWFDAQYTWGWDWETYIQIQSIDESQGENLDVNQENQMALAAKVSGEYA